MTRLVAASVGLKAFLACVVLCPFALYGGLRLAKARPRSALIAAVLLALLLLAVVVVFGREIVEWFSPRWSD